MTARIGYERELDGAIERWDAEAETPAEAYKLLQDSIANTMWSPKWNRIWEHSEQAANREDAAAG